MPYDSLMVGTLIDLAKSIYEKTDKIEHECIREEFFKLLAKVLEEENRIPDKIDKLHFMETLLDKMLEALEEMKQKMLEALQETKHEE